MTAISSAQLSYQVKWAKSKKLLDAFIDRYNEDKPLREQLRASHKQLAGHLLFLFSTAVAREQAYGAGIAAGSPLPRLRANNTQLAGMMGCSSRTVINLRKRLQAAGIIRSEEWHGSNSQYELELAPQIIHIQTPKDPDNLIIHFVDHPAARAMAAQQAAAGGAASGGGENFSPYSIQKQLQGTSKLSKLSGAKNSQTADFQGKSGNPPVDNREKPVEIGDDNVNFPQQHVGLDTGLDTSSGYETARGGQDTPPPVAAAPPAGRGKAGHSPARQPQDNTTPPDRSPSGRRRRRADNRPAVDPAGQPGHTDITATPPPTAPETFVQATAHLPEPLVAKIRLHVQTIWVSALHNLYPERWLNDDEKARALAVLAEYFAYARPDRYSHGATEVLERIVLVKRWIERGRARGEKRWVPIPSVYFDFRNEKGFRRTKPWYKKHIKAKAEIKSNELLTKAVKAYAKSLEPGAKVGPSETYRRLSQRLGKISKELLHRFHQQIADINESTDCQEPKASLA